ncbi:hypothetical protein [Paraburkholderia sp. Ac-20347]|uniref:hypothetical protein n=1 Tax=Paraburkholderia sp. Ac-20347 TaxID=2703892 RepID=UPI00197F3955|nr:hypothetical protein [Paraburkholderia sp. Ac-20347]MBN3809958.1 hypothetical protein [Paraburkholderia sp. Ac-20347]
MPRLFKSAQQVSKPVLGFFDNPLRKITVPVLHDEPGDQADLRELVHQRAIGLSVANPLERQSRAQYEVGCSLARHRKQ